MKVRCTICDRSGAEAAYVATVADGAMGADLMAAVAAAGFPSDTLVVDGRALEPSRPVAEHPLAHGSCIDAGAARRTPMPGDGVHLVVVSGPEAGAWCRLIPGRPVRVGRSDGELRLRRDASMSRLHVQFDFDGRHLCVTDLRSSNGTTIEGARLTEPRVVGLDTYVKVGASVLTTMSVSAADRAPLGPAIDGGFPFPRSYRKPSPELRSEFRLPRPMPDNDDGTPGWWRSLIPIVSGVGFAVVTGNLLFLLISALAPVIFAIDAMRQRTRRAAKREVARRQHHDDSVAARRSFGEVTNEERRRARQSNPMGGVAHVLACVRHERLWERRPDQPDWLAVTVGLAVQASVAALVDQAGDDTIPQHRSLWGSPVTFDFAGNGTLAVLGPLDRARALVRSLLIEIGVANAPNEVNIWLFTGGDGEREWGGVRWLPHAMDQADRCRIAANTEARSAMLSSIRQVLDRRREARRGFDKTLELPVHIVVFDGSTIVPTAELSELLVHGAAVGIYGIVIDASVAPDGTMGTLRLGVTSDLATFESRRQPLQHGVMTAEMPADRFDSGARRLAALRPSVSDDASLSATSARLADMVSAASTTPVALAAMWQVSGGTTAVPVGTTADAPFVIDVDEHGPHGLVGGMAGSGKTEFLKTLIMSLAWANHPDDLAFVIIDFKGEVDYSLAKALPHVVDFVSNRDLPQFERTVRMLSAEIERRQAIFTPHRVANLGAYREVRARHTDLPPVPRLVVIVDEFAELLSSDAGRDQLGRLESMSRIGRAFGVHQLLITQSFSAKLPDQIAANAGLRVCFRVQEAPDSKLIIDTGQGATIPASAPGRGYARLRDGDPIEFQSARVAGRRPDLKGDERAVTLRAQPFGLLRVAVGPAGPRDVPAEQSDMFAMIETIAAAANGTGWRESVIPWPRRLPDDLELASVIHDRQTWELPIGLADRPSEQRQVPFSLTTTGEHVAIVGGPRADLNGVLTTIACSAAATHSPDELHLIVVDFAGRGLARIGRLPHCGAAVSRNEGLALRVGKYLVDEMGARRAALAAAGVGSIAEFEQRTGNGFPHILVLIAAAERLSAIGGYDEASSAADSLSKVIAEGVGLGIQVVAAGLPSFANHRPGSFIDHRIVLTSADVGDYLSLGCPRGLIGELSGPRRAVDLRSKLVVQVASLAAGSVGESDAFDALAFRLAELWPEHAIRRPPRQIRDVTWPTALSSVARMVDDAAPTRDSRVPIGIDSAVGDLVLVDPIDVGGSMFVSGGRRTGRSNALIAIGLLARAAGHPVIATAANDRSPLFDPGCPLDATPLSDVPAALVALRSAVVLIDDADRVEHADPSSVPETLAGAELYVLSGSSSWFSGMQRAITGVGVPPASGGVVLVPTTGADFQLAPMSRGGPSITRQAGQGLLVVDGVTTEVTIPLIDRQSVTGSIPR